MMITSCRSREGCEKYTIKRSSTIRFTKHGEGIENEIHVESPVDGESAKNERNDKNVCRG